MRCMGRCSTRPIVFSRVRLIHCTVITDRLFRIYVLPSMSSPSARSEIWYRLIQCTRGGKPAMRDSCFRWRGFGGLRRNQLARYSSSRPDESTISTTNCPAIHIRDRTLATALCGKVMALYIARWRSEKFSAHKSRPTPPAIIWSKSADRSSSPNNRRSFSHDRLSLSKVNACIGLYLCFNMRILGLNSYLPCAIKELGEEADVGNVF